MMSGREEVIFGEDVKTQPHRSMQEPKCDISYSRFTSQIVGKHPSSVYSV